jgi:cellulose synthase/poly-beta-1,6-N-acetylglucosamine synthase-like glycosyltransferase
LVIWLVSRSSDEIAGDPKDIKDWPGISVIVPVHNEDAHIRNKIENLRSLDYPIEKLEIIFVSDGSTDKTNTILSQFNDIKTIIYSPRKGKPAALNVAVEKASMNYVLFTDVRQEIDVSALKYLLSTLTVNNIGAVSGELVHRDPVTHTGRNVGLYWRYEKWIRKAESIFYSTAGVTGALYMIRTEDYIPLREDTLLDDFEVPINILQKGKRVIFEPRAKIFDDVQEEHSLEQKRKIRTLTGNYQSFVRNSWLFSPIKNRIFFQFMSHKVFRLLVPYALMTIIITSYTLDGLLYQILFWLQILFYSTVVAASIWPGLRMNRIINLAVVFVSMNWAVLIALKNIIVQQIDVRWEKI